MVSQYFSVGECTLLPSWQVYHQPSDDEKANITKLANIMDVVREFLGQPIHVNCWIRPTKANCPGTAYHGRNYNASVGGAPNSSHITGQAVDFRVSSQTADDVRQVMLNELSKFELYMEDLPGSSWTHLSNRPTASGNHFFKP